MKTAAYTICLNEIKNVERWVEFTSQFDYRVVLDTGSTDGTYEVLKKVPGIILHQQRIEPFKFHEHRNLNLKMIPVDCEWGFSPDFDEWYSLNALDEVEKIIKKFPETTLISSARLDICSPNVFAGPPKQHPSNKIHKLNLYEWRAPVFEHLWYIGPDEHKEVYSSEIYLIHDQDKYKPRNSLYEKIMQERYKEDPTDNWNGWYLLNHYYKEKNLIKYIEVAVNFCKFNVSKDDKYYIVLKDLNNICKYESRLDTQLKDMIVKEIQLM